VIETRLAEAALTLSVAEPCKLLYVAVIVTVPAAVPVAKPSASILTTFESEELHTAELVTSLVVLSERCAVAVNCCVPPVPIDVDPGVTCTEETVGAEEKLFDPSPPLPPQPVKMAMDMRSAVQNAAFMLVSDSRFNWGFTLGRFRAMLAVPLRTST